MSLLHLGLLFFSLASSLCFSVKSRIFQSAGLKDRRAITTQHYTAFMYIHTHTCTHTHTHMHVRTHTHNTHTLALMHVCAHTHTHTHTHIHTHNTHTHTHTHTHRVPAENLLALNGSLINVKIGNPVLVVYIVHETGSFSVSIHEFLFQLCQRAIEARATRWQSLHYCFEVWTCIYIQYCIMCV